MPGRSVILNIIDKRTRRYRWKQITAIVEPTHYDQREEISLTDAVIWASSLPYAVTLYFYDLGDGVSVAGRISNLKN